MERNGRVSWVCLRVEAGVGDPRPAPRAPLASVWAPARRVPSQVLGSQTLAAYLSWPLEGWGTRAHTCHIPPLWKQRACWLDHALEREGAARQLQHARPAARAHGAVPGPRPDAAASALRPLPAPRSPDSVRVWPRELRRCDPQGHRRWTGPIQGRLGAGRSGYDIDWGPNPGWSLRNRGSLGTQPPWSQFSHHLQRRVI